jgi:hypothetical protein
MKRRVFGIPLKATVLALCLILVTLGLASAQEGETGAPAATGSGTVDPIRLGALAAINDPVDCATMPPPVVGYEISKGQVPTDTVGLLNDLSAGGYSVGTVNISAGPIPACVEVLIVLGLSRNLALSSAYTSAQAAALKAWVAGGHGLMALSDWGTFKDSTQALFLAYGYTLLGGASGAVTDPTDYDPAGPSFSWVIYQTDNFAGHPALSGIASVELVRSSWFTPTLNALVTTDADANPPTMPVMAALTDGAGCAVLASDSNWITQYDNAYLKQDNARAARQIVGWLKDCAVPSVPVTGSPRIYMPLVVKSECVSPGTYSHNFEGAVGTEWSSASTDITPSGRRFLGQFGNETVTLTLACLPAHASVSVSFDLFLIRSWDGNVVFNPAEGIEVGPDVWDVSVAGGPTLLHTTFANWTWSNYRQAYPGTFPGGDYAPRTGAAENNSLGYEVRYEASSFPLDSVYHLTLNFPHTAGSLGMNFSAAGLQILSDESWGLDNVEVRFTP